MSTESWVDIPEYEGLYQISNKGRVKSVERFSINHSSGSGFYKKERILKQYHNKTTGYFSVNLSKNDLRKTKSVHYLMRISFFDNTNSELVIDHLNGIKTDNNLSNLQLITQSENVRKSLNKDNCFSKYIGVQASSQPDRWRSRIRIKGEIISLGQYTSEEEAAEVFDVAFKNKNLYGGNREEFKNKILTIKNKS